MTDKQLHELADKYADHECAMSKLADKTQLHEDKIVEFFDVVGFLFEHCCIATKEQVKAIRFRKVYSADVRSKFTEECLIDALFPEIANPDPNITDLLNGK